MSAFEGPAGISAEPAGRSPDGGRPDFAAVHVGDSRILFGTASWADKRLVRAGTFYPSKSMGAAERLRFYSSEFSVCEVTTTYRYPPTREVTSKWAERSVDGFVFDVCAWSLLTYGAAVHDSLWPDLQDAILPRFKDTRRLYASHLPAEVLDECFERFRYALLPLFDAGRLGAVVLRYPAWFSPRPANLDALERAAAHLEGFRVVVDVPGTGWYPTAERDGLLDWLEERDLALACTAAPPQEPGVRGGSIAGTSDLAFIRFTGTPDPAGNRGRSAHRYSPAELEAWVSTIDDLASSASEVHVIMDNAAGAAPVDNARELAGLLSRSLTSTSPPRGVEAATTRTRSSRLATVKAATTLVKGSSGFDLAVHHLGGDGPPLMLAHATGFHGRCWSTVASELTDHFSVWALDQRGHGSSARPSDGRFAWDLFASDLLQVVETIGGDGWCAGGHSLGGGVVLLAEARSPGTFASICCYEPVVVPPHQLEAAPTGDASAETRGPVSLATLARKRRATFASRDAALENYRSKPPFSAFDPAALDDYVRYGFVDEPDGSVSLACRPDDEAAVFEMAPSSPTWDLLGEVKAKVTVFAGRKGGDPVGLWAEAIASRIPSGRFEAFDSLDHFGPMTAPSAVGQAFAQSLLDSP